MAKRMTKEELFRLAYADCRDMIDLIDHYCLGTPSVEDSLTLRVFKIDFDRCEADDEDIAKEAFRKIPLWENLDLLYDYAVEGILSAERGPDEIALGGAEALMLASRGDVSRRETERALGLVNAAEGRHALDAGENIELTKLADLANVDERTVRNAISAGELTGSGKPVFINNQSARLWLRNRRGYRPTQVPSDESASFADVRTPLEFGAFLKAQYERLYADSERASVIPMHPAIGADTLAALEAGVFNLPLDTASVLADFYQLERGLFLIKVMEVFFSDELYSLRQEAMTSRSQTS